MAKRVAAAGPVDGPWALPDGWRWERLGDVASRIADKHSPDPASLLPFVGMDAIAPYSMAVGATQPFGQMRSAASAFKQGDVLYGRLRPYLNKVWHATYAGACSGELIVIRPSVDVDARYLAFLLHSNAFVEFASHAVAGDRPRIDFGTMAAYPVPIPPIEVQRAIVARIDELFAEIDDGEAALARARDDLATWRKALLKAAVTGELTADWRAERAKDGPPAETGADLLARILTERRARWEAEPCNKGKRYKERCSSAIDGGRELPSGWTWASVDQIGEVVTGNTPPAIDAAAYDGDVPFFTPGDLDAGFALDITKRTLGPSGLAKSRRVPSRSVLITCIGATIGKVGFNARAGATNQQINTIIPAVDDIAEYVFHYFDGPGRHDVIDGSSSTTMPIINKGDFSRLPVPLPPSEEAREISRLVAARYADANAAWEDMKDVRLGAATLRQSILAAAFRGELVA